MSESLMSEPLMSERLTTAAPASEAVPPGLHPCVALLGPSDDQIPAVAARHQDVVVTAGAGTGKTRTLVARYLALLAEGQPLRGLVAITFTRKAAREMRNRVREQLRRYLELPDLAPDERRRWARHYGDLDAARIGTIHSLCTELLQSHPAESGVDPRFSVLDEGRVGLLRAEAVAEALGWAANDPAASALFARLGELELQRVLAGLLERRLEVPALPADPWARWQAALDAAKTARLAALLADPEWARAEQALRDLLAGVDLARHGDDRLVAICGEVLAALARARAAGDPAIAQAGLGVVGEIKLTAGSARAWPGGADDKEAAKQWLKSLRERWQSAAEVLALALGPADRALADAQPALGRLFARASDAYEARKGEQNGLDYDDLEARALALLRAHPAVRRRWQVDIAALLVDEFQDTNARQRELLDLLNEDGGKLFVVGDAKQSIYRFRGADVTVFRAVRERISAAAGAVCALSVSYRAHPELIAGLNDLLAPILGRAADPARPWLEPFAPLVAQRRAPDPGFAAPHIELHLAVGSKRDGALARAAAALAARLVELVESGTVSVQPGPGEPARPLDYGDIGVLCRASTSFAAYEDAFEAAGVPYVTVAGRGFYDRPEVRDLLNALRALSDPHDDLALVGLLRSPAFAVSDGALYQLVRHRAATHRERPLWELLPDFAGQAAAPDDAALARALAIVPRLQSLAGRVPVADLLKALLDETGYRAALLRAGQRRAVRNLSKLLGDAQTSGIVSAGEFLAYVGALRDTGAREGEGRVPAEGVVQLLSVHAAKGLEFPVLAIGDAGYSPVARAELLLAPELGILLPRVDSEGEDRPAIYELARRRADDEERAEHDRLLYVAATRARDKLLINGTVRASGSGRLSAKGWLEQLDGAGLGFLAAGPEATFDCHVGGQLARCVYYAAEAPVRRARRAPEPARPPTPPPLNLLAPVAPPPSAARPPESGRVWQVVPLKPRPHAPQWLIGALVQAALANWRFPGEAAFEAWIEARARGFGLADRYQLGDARRATARLLARFRAHELYAELADAGRLLLDVPYSVELDGEPVSGSLDALLRAPGADGWSAVAFNTHHFAHAAELPGWLVETGYGTQLAQDVTALTRLLGARPQLRLCLLDCGGGVHVAPEAVWLAGVAPAAA